MAAHAARPAPEFAWETRKTRRPLSQRHPLSHSLEFGPYREAVPAARLHTRAILSEWELAELADDAESVIAELMANAIEIHQRENIHAPVRLTLLAGLRTLLIGVRDAADSAPCPGSPAEDDECGRGLLIVGALAAYWDTKPCPEGGKIVRALLRAKR